ncbi:MAG: hypothetical protein TREMPRED_001813 [Tremellales sp. Tagirdzhanova-0007]|nr:MAG: hypothetical protein TREMPRED_001813 [Tremellales sp. Tagirdzhanova-0007]
MVNTAAQFDKAVAIVKALPPDGPVKPSQDDQLADGWKQLDVHLVNGFRAGAKFKTIGMFYGHFKQANDGDCTGPAPGAFDFKGKYKYRAWKALEGMSKDDAKAKYVQLLQAMLEKTDDEANKKYLAELEVA